MGIAARHTGPENCWEVRERDHLWIYRAELSPGSMKLLIFSERGKIDPLLWKQTAEGVRLSMGVWGKQHDQTDLSELVRAILMDEPIKMRRLGDLYHIDVEALSDMWILKSQTTQKLSRWVKQIRELSGNS